MAVGVAGRTMKAMDSALLMRELHPPLSAEEALLEPDRCLGCGGPHAEAPSAAAFPAERHSAESSVRAVAGP